MEIINGIVLGLSTLLFMGVVFFYLLETAITSGRKAGFAAATGVIAGDIIYVLLLLFGFAELLASASFKKWFALIGGIILIGIGLLYLLKKQQKISIVKDNSNSGFSSVLHHFTKGFAINFVNPFVAAVWLGFFTITQNKFSSISSIAVSLTVTLIFIYGTDLLKVYYAEKLSSYFKGKVLRNFFKVIGIVMLLFGLKLLYSFSLLKIFYIYKNIKTN